MVTCTDLRLGGTLSATGIAGGTSINGTNYWVTDWSDLFGSAGIASTLVSVYGRPGGYPTGDQLGLARFPTLRIGITDRNATGGLTEPTFAEQKEANTDAFLALITNPAGQYLEVDMADASTRFLHVRNVIPAPIIQPRRQRRITVPLESAMPYWKAGDAEDTDTVNGTAPLAVGGNREVYDFVAVFAGDGTLTHNSLGWSVQIIGSAGPVTVDFGARTVTEGGLPADNLLRRSHRNWGWLVPGSNSVTTTVSTVFTWRSSFA